MGVIAADTITKGSAAATPLELAEKLGDRTKFWLFACMEGDELDEATTSQAIREFEAAYWQGLSEQQWVDQKRPTKSSQ